MIHEPPPSPLHPEAGHHVRPDGTTTCCEAYTSIFTDDGTEYCKRCFEAVTYAPAPPTPPRVGNERAGVRSTGIPYARAVVTPELGYAVECPSCGHLSTVAREEQRVTADYPKAAARVHGEHWLEWHVQSVHLRVPATFMADHLSRFDDGGEFGAFEVERTTKTVLVVWLTPAQVRNLVEDALHYGSSGCYDVDDWWMRSLVESARTTVRSLERQGVDVSWQR